MNYGGSEKLMSLKFHGNQHVDPKMVLAAKSNTISSARNLRILKGLGTVASLGGVFISGYMYHEGYISATKLTADIVFTGIGFVPGVGWVFSGAYFILDGTVGVDVDGAAEAVKDSAEKWKTNYSRMFNVRPILPGY
jgi:hypothetical protein